MQTCRLKHILYGSYTTFLFSCIAYLYERNMSDLLKPASFCSAGELLYMNEDLSDLSFIVKTGTARFQFPAHALVLAAESSIFHEMIQTNTQDETKQIVVSDMSPSTAELLLRFIYSGKLEVECWTEAVDLLSAAFKYKITDLIQKCGRFLEDIISPTNVCYIYNKASSCSVTTLQDKCLKLILDAGFMVLRSSAFELLSKDCVMDVVSSSDLNIDSELIVFETLLRWARLECCRTGQPTTEANILSELKPFLQHVCVDDMSDADKSALPPSVLSCVKPNNRNRIGFSVPESLLLYSQCFELEMSQNCSDFVGENFSCLRFSIDSSLHLIGLRFTAVSVNPPLNLAMTLIKENTPKATMFMYNVLETSWVQILRQNQNIWYSSEILLKQPIFLKSGDIYCLSINSYAVKCPRTTISSNILRLSNGPINFTVHSEDIWGITGLIFI